MDTSAVAGAAGWMDPRALGDASIMYPRAARSGRLGRPWYGGRGGCWRGRAPPARNPSFSDRELGRRILLKRHAEVTPRDFLHRGFSSSNRPSLQQIKDVMALLRSQGLGRYMGRGSHGGMVFIKQPPTQLDPDTLGSYNITLEQYIALYNDLSPQPAQPSPPDMLPSNMLPPASDHQPDTGVQAEQRNNGKQ